MKCFNPSYTGCATGSNTGRKKMSKYYQSFNPSYTGCATGSQRGVVYRTLHWLVSILLILDVLLEAIVIFEKENGYLSVSILLILDVLLEEDDCQFEPDISHRFNPSYTGCATGSSDGKRAVMPKEKSFNPSYTGCATGSSDGKRAVMPKEKSFNPSYTGCATGSIRRIY